MKIFGSSRHGAHIQGKPVGDVKKTAPKKNRKKLKIILLVVLLLIAALAVAAVAYYKTAVKPPDTTDTRKPTTSDIEQKDPVKKPEEKEEEPVEEERGTYTFLILGTDDGNGNTDTIMAATFDVDEYTLDVVSIPRDTLVCLQGYRRYDGELR